LTRQVPNPHTPEQERLFSNIGHWIEGGIISLGAAAMLREVVSADAEDTRLADGVLGGAGALLGLGLVAGSFHHGGPAVFFRADPQQQEHLKMAALLTGGAGARRLGLPGRLISSLFTARIGQMFLIHEQHGTSEAAHRAKERHARLGKMIVAAAATTALSELTKSRSIRVLGALLLLGAGVQLALYREPEGAYEAGEEHAS
jgi:hypothetical protein